MKMETTAESLDNKTLLSWFHAKGYAQGVFWIICVSLISNGNDILMRLLGSNLPSMEIAFFRFFFAALLLLPIMLYKGLDSFKTSRPVWHISRGILGFGAVASWCYGVGKAPLALVATIALTVPLFVLPMAALLLKERVGWQRLIATLLGFIGILIIVYPDFQASGFDTDDVFNIGVVYLLMAALLFAVSDIVNKFMVSKESQLTLLFYFAVVTSIAGAYPAYKVWVDPSLSEIGLLLLLGAGGNLILYCLLKAFSAVDVSALAPYRYVELIFASGFGFLIFGEIPEIYTLLGAAIIVPSTFAIAYYETHKTKDETISKVGSMDETTDQESAA